MDYKERRALDVLQTDKLAKFIDANIYSVLPEKITRIFDKNMQLKGIDLKWDGLNVDEKCAIYYINKDLQTFAFEISALNNRDENGWFLNKPFIETEAYILGYLKGDIMRDTYDEIELLLIKKAKLWSYLNQYNLETRIEAIIRNIRNGKLSPTTITEWGTKRYELKDIPYTSITWSENLKESPINIVIRKSLLLKLCSKRILFDGHKTSFKDYD